MRRKSKRTLERVTRAELYRRAACLCFRKEEGCNPRSLYLLHTSAIDNSCEDPTGISREIPAQAERSSAQPTTGSRVVSGYHQALRKSPTCLAKSPKTG